jgi:hypothetical protein
MANPFTVYIISHSHTDIGYTDRQEKITRYHADFIKQVVQTNRELATGKHEEWQGFKWTCENYWQVEQFLKVASIEDQNDFHKFVAEGKIDVSLNYLNLNELVDDQMLRNKLKAAKDWAEYAKFTGNSALTADINGYSWGYAQALSDYGITNLFSCVHSHHGMAPLKELQRPFKWQTPNGQEVFVWSGDHYNMGNEFLLVPNSNVSPSFQKQTATERAQAQVKLSQERVTRYVTSLKANQYAFNYVPIMVSGVFTDNAPANAGVMEMIQAVNKAYHGEIVLKMVTLNEFFEVANKEENIPTYSGDWNDWWADGVGSTPAATKIYKEAQRKYHLVDKLSTGQHKGLPKEQKCSAYNMMLYAEHTWGYSSSVSEPWNTLVNDLEYRNIGYATQANVAISKDLDELLATYGEVSIRPKRDKLFKILNPHDHAVQEMVTLFIEYWETVDEQYIDDENIKNIVAVDQTTGEYYATQAQKTARATEVKVWLSLEAKANKTVKITLASPKVQPYDFSLSTGKEGVQDVITNQSFVANEYRIENDIFSIEFSKQGISKLFLKKEQLSLLDEKALYPAFTGVYEVTPVRTDPVDERRLMGRNRKGKFVNRFSAQLKNIQIIADGPIFTSVLLEYDLAGTTLYAVMLKIFKTSARIEATVRMHKTSQWEPENLYVALPFSLPEATKYLDKTGCLIRPAIDQLPDSNSEFYLSQNGLVTQTETGSLFINCNDAPLLTFGSLDSHEIQLQDSTTHWKNTETAYSWVMNNFWETNFKAELGGFYEFNYALNYQAGKLEAAELTTQLTDLAQGIIGIPI